MPRKAAPDHFNALQRRLFQRNRADVFSLTTCTLPAFPQGIELLQHAVDQAGRIGPDSHLKIAPTICLGAQSCAGEIRRAEIHFRRVDDDGFGMQPRTASDGEVFGKFRPQFPQCRGAGRSGMKQPDFDTLRREASKDFNDRPRPPRAQLGNEHRLEVRGHDIDAGLRGKNPFSHDPQKMLAIDDQFTLAIRSTLRRKGEYGERGFHSSMSSTGRTIFAQAKRRSAATAQLTRRNSQVNRRAKGTPTPARRQVARLCAGATPASLVYLNVYLLLGARPLSHPPITRLERGAVGRDSAEPGDLSPGTRKRALNMFQRRGYHGSWLSRGVLDPIRAEDRPAQLGIHESELRHGVCSRYKSAHAFAGERSVSSTDMGASGGGVTCRVNSDSIASRTRSCLG
jgi:hypothetical protein